MGRAYYISCGLEGFAFFFFWLFLPVQGLATMPVTGTFFLRTRSFLYDGRKGQSGERQTGISIFSSLLFSFSRPFPFLTNTYFYVVICRELILIPENKY